ncbi:sigma-70 family RNA polymerase sigma factor [Gemmata sp. JC717]|uniref:sigma-70 family RNA polymerase sigma factor n=1 Tax=Gemmata algarum TaxID=2975278 RepID=UPI0021BA5871|nr:sigma-70 family RNA polymerase sigma factor [Gemmata algarum]MDY3552225.1 sigma-70 family RNA polymerase sigma factor [Gemmata algarum]
MNPAVVEATRLWTLAVPHVSAFVTSLVRDFQDRDDVLQETAVAVLNAFGRYDPAQPFVAWAIGIARNQVRLHCRRKNRERIAFDSDAVDALAHAFAVVPPHDPRLDHLGRCVEALDPQAKELCRLRYELDLKPARIGERTGTAASAVAKALQRVRDRLRACVERKALEAGA